jgi:hypothetical protein
MPKYIRKYNLINTVYNETYIIHFNSYFKQATINSSTHRTYHHISSNLQFTALKKATKQTQNAVRNIGWQASRKIEAVTSG